MAFIRFRGDTKLGSVTTPPPSPGPSISVLARAQDLPMHKIDNHRVTVCAQLRNLRSIRDQALSRRTPQSQLVLSPLLSPLFAFSDNDTL